MVQNSARNVATQCQMETQKMHNANKNLQGNYTNAPIESGFVKGKFCEVFKTNKLLSFTFHK